MRKGQAAMEFLMTYGWAILVVLAAIGALAYFGVLSPDKFLPDKCTISPPISCLEYKASSISSNVSFNLQQDSGNTLNVTRVDVEGCTSYTTPVITVENNEKTGVVQLACSGLTTGRKFKANVNVTYIPYDGSISRTVSGTLQVKTE